MNYTQLSAYASKKNGKMKENNRFTIEQINAQYGKLPPQCIDVEEAVLGELMVDRDAISKVSGIITEESFYKEEHQKIFNAIVELSNSNKPIDILTVTQKLKDKNQLEEIGGLSFISQLTARIGSAYHIEFHARIIAQKFIQREFIRISSEIQNKAYDDMIDVQELFDFVNDSIDKVSGLVLGNKIGSGISNIIDNMTAEIQRRSTVVDKGGLTGIDTGFPMLNRITSGWQPNWLIILAARPAMGKTAVAVNKFAKCAAIQGKWVNIFSLEMEDISLTERLIVGISGINPYTVKRGTLTDEEWIKYNESAKTLKKLPIIIDDNPYVSINHIRNVARLNKKKNKCDLIIIDYLQLANATSTNKQSNREQDVAGMTRQLKSLAKELKVPIILISQLSREVEKRGGNKRPNMADLRESGAIEQDADLIFFAWRPSVYGIEAKVENPNNYGQLIFAKNRHGHIKDIDFWHNESMTEFSDKSFAIEKIKPIISR